MNKLKVKYILFENNLWHFNEKFDMVGNTIVIDVRVLKKKDAVEL